MNVVAGNTCGASGTRSQSWTGTVCREEGTGSTADFSVYPNPAHDKVTVSIFAQESSKFNISLRDISGRVILSEDHDGAAGLNAYEMNLKNYAKGIYTIEVQSASDNWKTKVVVE